MRAESHERVESFSLSLAPGFSRVMEAQVSRTVSTVCREKSHEPTPERRALLGFGTASLPAEQCLALQFTGKGNEDGCSRNDPAVALRSGSDGASQPQQRADTDPSAWIRIRHSTGDTSLRIRTNSVRIQQLDLHRAEKRTCGAMLHSPVFAIRSTAMRSCPSPRKPLKTGQQHSTSPRTPCALHPPPLPSDWPQWMPTVAL